MEGPRSSLLDPLATGVLVILLGKATKLFNKFVTFDKAYRATLILGTATTSADTQGEIIEQKPFSHITAKQVEEAFEAEAGQEVVVKERFQTRAGEVNPLRPPGFSGQRHGTPTWVWVVVGLGATVLLGVAIALAF